MAARRFSWADGKELTSSHGGTLAADDRPFTRNVRGDPSVRDAARHRRMAATYPDRRQSLGDRLRHLSVRQQTPSAGAGADTTDATRALVLRGGDRAWRRTDARTNLYRAVPSR